MTWIVKHADGDVTQHFDKPGTCGIAKGKRSAETPRMGDLDREEWDWGTKSWIPVAEGQARYIDTLYGHTHGSHAVTMAQIEKRLEARIIMAGVPVDGLIAEEARATGQTIEELCRVILEKAASAKSLEVERICKKRIVRGMDVPS